MGSLTLILSSYRMNLLPWVAKPFKTHILLMMKRINITKKNFETMETRKECEQDLGCSFKKGKKELCHHIQNIKTKSKPIIVFPLLCLTFNLHVKILKDLATFVPPTIHVMRYVN